MAGIWFSGGAFVASLSEIAGYKSGLALGEPNVERILVCDERFRRYWPESFESAMRIRSEVYEDVVAWVLFKVGNIESPSTESISIRLARKYMKSGQSEVYESVLTGFTAYLNSCLLRYETSRRPEDKAIKPDPFVDQMIDRHGKLGGEIAEELFEGLDAQLHRSPWSLSRVFDWVDTVELRDLFESEGLKTAYGHFFDQRFIDYLHRNFDDVDRMNWRKFEGMTAEFFAREGFRVEIGSGRGDDGVDLRVWAPTANAGEAPTILVQCKRQQEKVSKVIVKALYADVLHEQASSGLIVTTSSLSPGAAKTCTVRSYPVRAAERTTLAQWLDKMRTPHVGVFMGE